jgi:hypothetical protein
MPQELNLLPPSRRTYLVGQLMIGAVHSILRSLIVASILVTVAGVGAIAFLQFMIAASSSNGSVVLAQKIKAYQDLRTGIATQNASLKTLNSLSNDRIVWSKLWPDLFAALPPGTVMFSLSADVLPSPHFSFSGQALARSALVVLQDRLHLISWVDIVNAPDSNLLDRDNPKYQFDVYLKKTTPAASPKPTLKPTATP